MQPIMVIMPAALTVRVKHMPTRTTLVRPMQTPITQGRLTPTQPTLQQLLMGAAVADIRQ
jgi:hypothetical protein